jgi:hypothetical protein
LPLIARQAAAFRTLDLSKLHGEERERYLLLLSVVVQFNEIAWMMKVGMPKSLFPSRLAMTHFLLRLTIPDFPHFHFTSCADVFLRILYNVTRKCLYDDWIFTTLFNLCFNMYMITNHVRFFSPE